MWPIPCTVGLGIVRRPVETLDCGNAVGSEDDGRNTARPALTAHTEYIVGRVVDVLMPTTDDDVEWRTGVIVGITEIFGTRRYEVHGTDARHEFVTLASQAVLRPN